MPRVAEGGGQNSEGGMRKEDKIMETAKVRTGQRALLRETADIVHNSASIG